MPAALQAGCLSQMKSRRKRRTYPASEALMPTPELGQHHAIEVGDRIVFGEDGRATSKSYGARVLTQRLVDRYHRGKAITHRQHAAAERFWADFFAGGLEPRAVANLNRAGGPGECTYGMAATERQAAARGAWRDAVQAVGIHLSPILIGVVCDDRPASDCVRGRTGRQAEIIGLDRLRIALETLADHYGLDGRTP